MESLETQPLRTSEPPQIINPESDVALFYGKTPR